jgi:hypothetical protein
MPTVSLKLVPENTFSRGGPEFLTRSPIDRAAANGSGTGAQASTCCVADAVVYKRIEKTP